MDPLKSASAKAAALAALVFALAPLTSVAQDLQRHGEVTGADGQEVTVQLSEGLSVSSGTGGTIYTTTTVGGEERSVRVAQVEVTGAEGRRVTAEITNQTEAPETGFAVSFESIQRLGTLVVEATPTEATVSVDGNAVGTGTVRQQVQVGEHAVTAEVEGYQTARRGVQIGAGETRRVSVSLQQATGQLVVEARPDSARIVIGGQMRDRGRAEATLSPGTYGVAVRAGGHVPIDTTAEVSAGEETTLSASLQRASGQLLVTTEPDSARIEIDGQRAGRAPVIRDLPVGQHEVRAAAERYVSQRQSVTIAAGEREEVALVLNQISRDSGILVVETIPDGATVRIDGEMVGTAPARRRLSPGDHRVEVASKGYEGAERVVRVPDGGKRRVRLSMQRLRPVQEEEKSGTTVDAVKEVRFGITAGVVSSSFPSPESRVVTGAGEEVVSRRLGYTGGVFLTIDFPGSFALQPEVMYVQEGATVAFSSLDRQKEYINFVELPILAKYRLSSRDVLSLDILGGPVGGVSTTASPTGAALGFALGAEAGVTLGPSTLSLGIRYEADVTALSGGSSTPRPRSFLVKANLAF